MRERPSFVRATTTRMRGVSVYSTVNGDFELVLESGVSIVRAPGYNNDGVDVYSPDHAFTVTAADGVTISVDGDATDGIVVTAGKSIVIDSGAHITAGTNGLRGWNKYERRVRRTLPSRSVPAARSRSPARMAPV